MFRRTAGQSFIAKRGQTTLRLLAVMFIAITIPGPAATYARNDGDAWSAAERLEHDLLKIQPFDPDSFSHPEQYDERGRKITGRQPKTDAKDGTLPSADGKHDGGK
jgi:hypothetical protein